MRALLIDIFNLISISRYRNLKLRSKFFVTFFLYMLIITIILSFLYYLYSIKELSETTMKSTYEIVKKNSEIIDIKLSKIEESSRAIIIDKDLYHALQQCKPTNNYSLIETDKSVSKILIKYLVQSEDIYSAQMVTSYFVFGNNTSLITPKKYTESTLYKSAMESGGRLVWIPTYDYINMFDLEEMKNYDIPSRYIFSAVRLINSSYIEDGVIFGLDKSIESPSLIINIKEEFLHSIYNKSIPVKDALYFILTKDGYVVSSNDNSIIAKTIKTDWLNKVSSLKGGTSYLNYKGEKMIACYVLSRITGWISIVLIPSDELLKGITTKIKTYSIYIIIASSILGLFFSFIISGRITVPIRKLSESINRMGEGEFNNSIPVNSYDELGCLIIKFNEMNQKINQLIESTYKSKIRENEIEIMALNLQLNPHFLYNTLNIINWMSIESGNDNISNIIMKLCKMLQYTFSNAKEVTLFEDDLAWLKCYLDIMMERFEDKFIVEYDIDPILNNCKVPMLFMQPFVENSIIHGFEYIKSGGLIRISGKTENNIIVFFIEDNGIGICKEKLDNIMKSETKSIGISNVDKRIKLLYGQYYGVRIESEIHVGTKVIISMPYK